MLVLYALAIAFLACAALSLGFGIACGNAANRYLAENFAVGVVMAALAYALVWRLHQHRLLVISMIEGLFFLMILLGLVLSRVTFPGENKPAANGSEKR